MGIQISNKYLFRVKDSIEGIVELDMNFLGENN